MKGAKPERLLLHGHEHRAVETASLSYCHSRALNRGEGRTEPKESEYDWTQVQGYQ